MKNEGQVRQQLKQVRFRHQKKLLKANFRKTPSKCRFNGEIKRPSFCFGVCLYNADNPEEWLGLVCDEDEIGGIEQARNCDLFEPKMSKEEVKQDFTAFLRDHDLAVIAQQYPDVAALMWVLDVSGADLMEEEEGVEEAHMSHLLIPIQLWSKPLGKNTTPVALEFPVDPDSAPYLVTSSRSLMWIPEAVNGETVRAAIRTDLKTLGDLYREIIDSVITQGNEMKWGNTHPHTQEGLRSAIGHVLFYDQGEVELLGSEATLRGAGENGWFEDQENVVGIHEAKWLPDNYIVAVPKDRTFVGFVSVVGIGSLVSVVHNPSRGIAVAYAAPQEA